MANETKLYDIRGKIDLIDEEMSRLFSERMKAVTSIAEEKMKLGKVVLDMDREAEVIKRGLERIEDDSLKPLYFQFISKILELSKIYQQDIFDHRKNKEYPNED